MFPSSSRQSSSWSWRWCAGCDESCGELPLHRLTLTFVDQRTETEFVRHSKEDLRLWLGCASSIVFGIDFCVMIWEWTESGNLNALYPNAFLDLMATHIAVALLMAFNVFVTQLSCAQNRMSFFFLEAYGVLCALALVCVIVLSSPSDMARLRGYDRPRGGDGDASTLLLLVGLTMGLHLNPHIRWHYMIPVQVWSIASYGLVAMFLGYPQDRKKGLVYTFEFAGLVALASYGKRMNQIRERQIFAHWIAEKTSRVNVEWQLGQERQQQQQVLSLDPRPGDARSGSESLPTTTDTGKAFNISGEGGGDLDGVREIGQKEHWLVEARELSWKKNCIIGVGGFGIVIKGHYQGTDVAVKVPKTASQTRRSRSCLMELCNELQILRRLRHPNIVGFYGCVVDAWQNDLAVVLELVDGVPLRAYISGAGPSKVDKAQLLVQTACAVRYLHMQRPRIIHGDLKDTNIFVEKRIGSAALHSGRCVAKLLDFGLARRLTKSAPPMGGSLFWVAPEVARGQRAPGTASDIFSLGRVVYYVVTGNEPGESWSRGTMLNELRTGASPSMSWPAEVWAKEYRALVEGCTQAKQAMRPDIFEVHDVVTRICERYGGSPPPEAQMDPIFHRELRALRHAAKQWQPSAEMRHFPAAFAVGHEWRPQQLRPSVERCAEATEEEEEGGAAATGRLHKDFEVTPVLTQEAIIAPALVRCNFELPGRACCLFHATVHNLRNIVDGLAAHGCIPMAVHVRGQCAKCRTLVTADDLSAGNETELYQCDVCGEAVHLIPRETI